MAINKNHECEELSGIKCAIVEKNVSKERSDFLQKLLLFNQYTVMVQPTPTPKTAAGAESALDAVEPIPSSPETYTVGVTDVMFNPINAIFGRLLKTSDGHIVTLAFWKQKEVVAKDDIPYFENIL